MTTLQKWAVIQKGSLEELVTAYDMAGYSLAWITFRERKTGLLNSHKIERGKT